MANTDLTKAKKNKNDEFYTLYRDIEKEMNAYLEYDPNVFRGKCILLPCDDPEWSNFTKYFAQNFEILGLKKLISTSFAPDSKKIQEYIPTLFEMNDSQFDSEKTHKNGKIFVLTEDRSGDGKIDINDLGWTYLQGDGDFRSAEIKKLRDEADIIITNPPFSLFRDFLAWTVEADKKFILISNMNAITYKEVFPLIKNNQMWLGTGMGRWISGFIVPSSYDLYGTEARIDEEGNRIVSTNNCVWFTNLDHGRRHQPLQLMTMADNLKFNKKLKDKNAFVKYDNYDAIEVPFTEAIPSDYDGVMAVPISFLDKYNPSQFEILGVTQRNDDPFKIKHYKKEQYQNANDLNARGVIIENGAPKSMYARILIKRI